MMEHLTIKNNHVAMRRRISPQAIRKTPPNEIVVVKPEPSVEQKNHVLCGDNSKSVAESFDHYVVLDLKATSNKGKSINRQEFIEFRQEITEFSSILVNAVTGKSVSTFHTFVCPIYYPELSEFCKEYNGMLQTDVEDGAVMLSEALQRHQTWLEEAETENGGHLSFAVVTWGDWDCRTMLKQECSFKHVPIPHYFHRWINLKRPFTEKFGNNFWSGPLLPAVVEAAGLEWKGRLKGGESLANNKAQVLGKLIQQGAQLYITGELKGDVPSSPFHFP